MCTVCGCSGNGAKIEGEAEYTHSHADGTTHSHTHPHPHTHAPAHAYRPQTRSPPADPDRAKLPQPSHQPGLSSPRLLQVEQDILARNNNYASANRQHFDARGIFALNLVSGPGAGKTTLLVKTIESLQSTVAINVVEGDQQTSNDAERIRATGIPAVQINTGKGCHLDGQMVGRAIDQLQPAAASLFLIENVGNLVCPAAFALGEHHKVVILSVTEGEDKPLKYPDMFHAADVMLLSKCDLLPHLDFDADLAEANARRVNPRLTIFRLAASRGEGMAGWLDWIKAGLAAQQAVAGATDKPPQPLAAPVPSLASS